MGTTAKRRGERERFCQQLVREQRRSGSSIKAFCRSHGVSEPSSSPGGNGWLRLVGGKPETTSWPRA